MTDFDVMRRFAVPLAAVVVLLVSGCSATREGGSPPAATSTATALPLSPTASPTPATGPPTLPSTPTPDPTAITFPGTPVPSPRPVSPKPSGPDTPQVVNVTGTVTAGVEPGCLLIDDYLLINAPTSLVYAGVKVRLTLELRPDLVSTCQQGTPAMITSAQRL